MWNKQRIGIDVDGVLRDFCHGLIRAIKIHHPEYLKEGYDETAVPTMEPESGMVTDWYLENNFNCTKKDLQQIYWYDQAKWIMGNGRPFEENVRTLKYWMKHINKEWVCITSQKEHARHYTLSWLGKHELNFDKVVFVKGSDKWQVDVDYLIDDSPANYNYWKDGRQDEDGFILLDRPYNQKIKPTHRVFDLRGAERIIL
jgi:5'(3')-deoxyribonucleotidase